MVLINAGTNDCDQNVDVSAAGQRMRSLIESLLSAPDMSDTVIVLSTLIPSGKKNIEAVRPYVNSEYRALVDSLRSKGKKKVVLAEMDPPRHAGSQSLSYPRDYADSVHPNDHGYAAMASIWYNAISEAAEHGLIRRSLSVNESSHAFPAGVPLKFKA